MNNKAKIWYLGHSGFAVEVNNKILIFDYFINEPVGEKRSLASGVIEPAEIADKQVLVFISHSHPDHFNPIIFSWKDKIPNIQYYLSSDILAKYRQEGVRVLNPNQTMKEESLIIRTFKSNDEGIAFLVCVDDVFIYHAGDLNWWHWNGEPEYWNKDMASRYKHEISLIKEHPIDLAFLTTDPRLEAAELWGISYFLKQIDVKYAFPMHFGDDHSIMERIKDKTNDFNELSKVVGIFRRGQCFELDF